MPRKGGYFGTHPNRLVLPNRTGHSRSSGINEEVKRNKMGPYEAIIRIMLCMLVVSVPLAIWKLIDIIIWLF